MNHFEIKQQYIKDIRMIMLGGYKNIKSACDDLGITYSYFRKLMSGDAIPSYEMLYDTLAKLGKGTRISHYNIKEVNND
ncbi:hypothetical protein [Klebsiella aerogenes]|uniref:hypothetical protein n=1 Tax=Klebsiella aerogenes TaxID=548 RepID=UPI0037A3D948